MTINESLSTEIDARYLRSVLGHFVTGVTVVTTMTETGPVGMTVNSFTSVSLDPPLALFCAASSSSTGRHVLESGVFAVNILSQGQEQICRRFATTVEDRFADLEVRRGATGSPILVGALAFLDCRIVDRLPAGDHVIVLGRVVAAGVGQGDRPLVFFRGIVGWEREAARSDAVGDPSG